MGDRGGIKAILSIAVPVMLLTAVATFIAAGYAGCEGEAARDAGTVVLDGKTFQLELALTQEDRFRGLSGREEIDPSGGMLFVFPRSQVRVQQFVMRDCPVDIDIIYLDPTGRITAMHHMTAEEPRRPDEPVTPNPAMDKYENRLKRYSSRTAAQYVIELKGGALEGLNLEVGQKIDLDPDLKTRAQ